MTATDETTVSAINRLLVELAESRQQIKVVNDNLKDVAEQNDEWREAQDDIAELAEKRTKARKLLEADRDYQLVHSELEELKFKHKDLQEILSHHLVTHFSETGETTFTGPDGEELQIIVTAKPGK